MAKKIRISAVPAEGFRRAGRRWTHAPQDFAPGYIPADVLAQLKAEPNLKVKEVEIQDEKPGKPAPAGAAGDSNPNPPQNPPQGSTQAPTREEQIDTAIAAILKETKSNKKPAQKDIEAVMQSVMPEGAPKVDITKAELDAAWERATKKPKE